MSFAMILIWLIKGHENQRRDFFYQCEVLEYMYSFYDKINGIFNHLRLKYLNQKNDKWIDEKFHIEI
jgi:hypothetical protein